MKLQDFIEKFSEQFEETAVTLFNAGTEFKTLDEWSSLSSLFIIAMVDEEYGVALRGIDLQRAVTIEELFNIIKEKKSDDI